MRGWLVLCFSIRGSLGITLGEGEEDEEEKPAACIYGQLDRKNSCYYDHGAACSMYRLVRRQRDETKGQVCDPREWLRKQVLSEVVKEGGRLAGCWTSQPGMYFT